MVTLKYVIFIMKLLFFLFLFACNSFNEIESYIYDIELISISGNINSVIEIPSGTHDKFEVFKETGQIVQYIEHLQNKTNGNHIPFIFSVDSTSMAQSDHMFARFANNTLETNQVAGKVWNVKMKIQEEF